jgi:hypothetical protein
MRAQYVFEPSEADDLEYVEEATEEPTQPIADEQLQGTYLAVQFLN